MHKKHDNYVTQAVKKEGICHVNSVFLSKISEKNFLQLLDTRGYRGRKRPISVRGESEGLSQAGCAANPRGDGVSECESGIWKTLCSGEFADLSGKWLK